MARAPHNTNDINLHRLCEIITEKYTLQIIAGVQMHK